MPVHGRYTRILVDQFELSGVSNSLQFEYGADALDATNFLSDANEWVVAPSQATLTHAGYFHDKTAGLEQALYNHFASGAIVSALFGTSAVMCPARVFQQSHAKNMSINAPADGLIAVDGTWLAGSNGGFKRGYRIYTGTISAIGGVAGVDFGAAGVAGGFAWLHVTAIVGAAVGATIDVESDTVGTFATAVSEGTFTFSAVGAQQIALAGTVNRHVRLNATGMGGATSFTVTAIVALDGVTYNVP